MSLFLHTAWVVIAVVLGLAQLWGIPWLVQDVDLYRVWWGTPFAWSMLLLVSINIGHICVSINFLIERKK